MAAVGLVHNSAIARWEHDEVWTVAENVTMLAMPLFWLWITGRRFADYGLGVTNLKQQWDAVWACAIPFAAFALPSLLDWNGFAWLAILFIFGAPLAALYLFAFRLRKKAPAALAVAPCLLLAFAPHAMSRAAAGLMFYVFLLGPSEEVLFRGVIQSRLNLAFGRPFTFHGANWGLGHGDRVGAVRPGTRGQSVCALRGPMASELACRADHVLRGAAFGVPSGTDGRGAGAGFAARLAARYRLRY